MPCFADAEAASEDAAALPEAADPAFLHALHVRYFAAHLRRLPPPYTAMESSRMTCVYFCVVALDVLGALDDAAVLPPERRASIVEWVLARLVDADAYGGFVGGPFMGPEASSEYRRGHSAMTYTALAVLRTLGAEGRLSPAQRRRVSLALPQDRGAVHGDGEADMRFVYTACASAALLGDWSGVDADATRRYVTRTRYQYSCTTATTATTTVLLRTNSPRLPGTSTRARPPSTAASRSTRAPRATAARPTRAQRPSPWPAPRPRPRTRASVPTSSGGAWAARSRAARAAA